MRLQGSTLFGVIALSACIVPMPVYDITFHFYLPDGTSVDRTAVLSDAPYLALETSSCVNPPRYSTPPLHFTLEFEPEQVQVAPDSVRIEVSSQKRRVLRVGSPQASQTHPGRN